MKTSTKNMVLCALCAAIICVLAPIAVPIGPVPISLATFAVMLAGVLTGAKWGTIATAVYLLLGIVGVPVFAGYSAGIDKFAGPTGGYLAGYLFLSFLCGLIYYRTGRQQKGVMKYVWMFAAMLIGTAVLYTFGTAWFCIQSGTPVGAALGMCVLPFLPGDFLKMVVVAVVVPPVERALARSGNGFEPAAGKTADTAAADAGTKQ